MLYRGLRAHGQAAVVIQDGTGSAMPLPHFVRHSPNGFEWGYGGSGPADLALAILADATGDLRYALANHQQFKWEMVAPMAPGGWVLHRQEVQDWVQAHPTAEEELTALATEARRLLRRRRAMLADVAAGLARHSPVCRRCRRLLRTARSRARGYGERCWRLVVAQCAGSTYSYQDAEAVIA